MWNVILADKRRILSYLRKKSVNTECLTGDNVTKITQQSAEKPSKKSSRGGKNRIYISGATDGEDAETAK